MKKVLFVFTLLFGCFGLPYVNAVNLEPKVDKKSQERIIITTDLEVDDMNGIILYGQQECSILVVILVNIHWQK